MSLADKTESIAGLPLVVLLLGLVGAAGEYRHRTAGGPRSSPVATAGPCCSRGRAPTRPRRVAVATLATAVTLAVGLPLLGARNRRSPEVGAGNIRVRRRRDPRRRGVVGCPRGGARRARAQPGRRRDRHARRDLHRAPATAGDQPDGPRRDAVRRRAGRRRGRAGDPVHRAGRAWSWWAGRRRRSSPRSSRRGGATSHDPPHAARAAPTDPQARVGARPRCWRSPRRPPRWDRCSASTVPHPRWRSGWRSWPGPSSYGAAASRS